MQTIDVANAEIRISYKDIEFEIKSEISRLYGKSSNVTFKFIAPKDYVLWLSKKQALDLLKKMAGDDRCGMLKVFYDDNDEGVMITKHYCPEKKTKTTYTIFG